MNNRILIIAHAPLASALRDCAMHVYPECAMDVVALAVMPSAQPEDTLAQALDAAGAALDRGLLVLTDSFGATQANLAQKLVVGGNAKLRAALLYAAPVGDLSTAACAAGITFLVLLLAAQVRFELAFRVRVHMVTNGFMTDGKASRNLFCQRSFDVCTSRPASIYIPRTSCLNPPVISVME